MFTIPDVTTATYQPQSLVTSVDLDILAAPSQLTGVMSGCAVTAQGTPNNTVAVAAGVVLVQGTTFNVAAATSPTFATANATNPRIDLLVVTAAGALSVLTGTATSTPQPPPITKDGNGNVNAVALATVYIPPTGAAPAIASGAIVDKRAPISPTATRQTALGLGPYLTVPNGWGSKWRTARAAAGTRVVKICVIGDSIAQGWVGTNWWTNGWVNLVRQSLQTLYGNGGSGYVTFDYCPNKANSLQPGAPGTSSSTNDWTRYPDGNVPLTSRGGIGGSSLKNSAAGVGALHLPIMNGNSSLKVYALSDPSYGSYGYGINGGAQTTVSLTAANAIVATTVASPPSGTYTLDASVVSGTVELYGAAAYNATGLAIDNFATSGIQAYDFASVQTPGDNAVTNCMDDTALLLGPWDLVILALGINDVRNSSAWPVLRNNLTSIWSAIRNQASNYNSPDTIVMLYPNAGVSGFHDAQKGAGGYASQVYEVAHGLGAAVVDVWAYGGRSTEPWNTQGYMSGTDVHPSNTGHQQIANLITPLLTS